MKHPDGLYLSDHAATTIQRHDRKRIGQKRTREVKRLQHELLAPE